MHWMCTINNRLFLMVMLLKMTTNGLGINMGAPITMAQGGKESGFKWSRTDGGEKNIKYDTHFFPQRVYIKNYFYFFFCYCVLIKIKASYL